MEEKYYFLSLKNTFILCPCKVITILKSVFLLLKIILEYLYLSDTIITVIVIYTIYKNIIIIT